MKLNCLVGCHLFSRFLFRGLAAWKCWRWASFCWFNNQKQNDLKWHGYTRFTCWICRLQGNQVHECLEMSDVAPLVNTAATKKNKHYIVEGHCKRMVDHPYLQIMSSITCWIDLEQFDWEPSSTIGIEGQLQITVTSQLIEKAIAISKCFWQNFSQCQLGDTSHFLSSKQNTS